MATDPTLGSEGASAPMMPVLGIVLGGILWGLIWIPLRWLGDHGLTGAWPGAVMNGAALLLLLPVLAFRIRHIGANLTGLVLAGLFTGGAFSLYATSILLTDVVRAILLFYLTPVWGTLLGIFLLGERLTLNRLLAMACGILGMAVVLGAEAGIPLPRNIGDWLALASGIAWALGTMQLYRMRKAHVADQIGAFVSGSLLVSALTLLLGGTALRGALTLPEFSSALPLAFATAIYVLPMLFLTIWPATVLTPARIGLLLMGDVVVSVVSAAIWAGEPFGWPEATGTLLIISAGVIETLGRSPTVQEKGRAD